MRKKDLDNLVASIRQAGKIRRGEMKPSRVTELVSKDIKAIRQRLGKSQAEFATMIGVSVSTLQNWEQGRRRPAGPGPVASRGRQPAGCRGRAGEPRPT